MNLQQLINNVEIFIAQWAGTTAPRVVVAFLGILICVWVGTALWGKRIRIVWTTLGLIAGISMVLIAIDPRILRFLADTSFLTRIRIIMIVMSFLVVVITIEAIRRSHLQERYAIMWITTGLIILIAAFFPQILDFFSLLLGTQYVTSVVGIVFTFLLLIAFHFSIALSGMRKRQTEIAQRCAILEAKLAELSNKVAGLNPGLQSEKVRIADEAPIAIPAISPSQSHDDIERKSYLPRHLTGPQIASFVIIGISFLAVLMVGIITPQAMIGDEVTHYYMLVDQSKNLSQPNFYAHIPTAWGGEDLRRYPHSCLWHYLGGMVFRITGGSFYAVQVYQSLFWLQFLWMAFLLARQHGRKDSYVPVLYLLVLASLPISLIFSVAFYQDIPMAAQILTAFYLLWKRRWFWASLFMAVAIGLKISALLFLPVFFVLMGFWEYKASTWRRAVAALIISTIILGSFIWGMGGMLKKYGGDGFYPLEQLQKIASIIKDTVSSPVREQLPAANSRSGNLGDEKAAISSSGKAQTQEIKTVTPYEAKIIANHPGDLRIPENFFVYGGGILWLVIMAGGAAMIYYRYRKKDPNGDSESHWWLFTVGISYIIAAAYFLRTAPDARFFLPGLPFVLLPFVEGVVRLPRPKIIISIVAAIAILQGGQVLKKTYDLRNVSTGLQEAISYLQENPIMPPKIFMYPEGNYRLFPYVHDWYLKYRLRELWKGDNDARIRMLRQFDIGAVVIKKHLIAHVDEAITNLGVYPTYFVRDLEKDGRFRKLFENRDVVIYRVPKP
ncbi:MAG: DUF2304 family protein [Deltaproteobacteria bacterium]|nr:DUF2304 family protein [Deltaproteobacteria bacterium]